LGRVLVRILGAIGSESSSTRHFHGIRAGLMVLMSGWDMAVMEGDELSKEGDEQYRL